MRVLVVDDNVDACETLVALLNAMGHQAACVSDPRQALDAALGAPPQVAFLDLGMPHLDGYALARQLRERFSAEELRLVALSGYGDDESRRKSRRSGFDAHVTKPAEPALLAAIFSTLSRD